MLFTRVIALLIVLTCFSFSATAQLRETDTLAMPEKHFSPQQSSAREIAPEHANKATSDIAGSGCTLGLGVVYGKGFTHFRESPSYSASGYLRSTGSGPSLHFTAGNLNSAQLAQARVGFIYGTSVGFDLMYGTSRLDRYNHGYYGLEYKRSPYYDQHTVANYNADYRSTSFMSFGSGTFNIGLKGRLTPSITIGLHGGVGFCMSIGDEEFVYLNSHPDRTQDEVKYGYRTFGIGVFANAEAYLNIRERYFLAFGYDNAVMALYRNGMEVFRLQVGYKFYE